MDCHEAEAVLGALLDGELDPAVSTPVQAHAETCAKCRQRLAEFGRAETKVLLAEDIAPAGVGRGGGDRRVRKRLDLVRPVDHACSADV